MRPFRSTLLGVSALGAAFLAAGSVRAQETFVWEGLYVGGHGSYSGATGQWGFAGDGSGDPFEYRGEGGGAGILAGYMFRADELLLGVEGDINVEDLDAELNFSFDEDPFFAGKSAVDRLNAMASVRVKAGLTGELPVVGESLIYGTLGVAFGRWTHASDLRFTINDDTPISFIVVGDRQSEWRTGLQFGGGVEVPITDRLSFKFEVIHTDYENQPIVLRAENTVDGDLGTEILRMDERVTSARIGVNWRF